MVKLETCIFITQFSEMWSEVRKISKNFKLEVPIFSDRKLPEIHLS